MTPRQYFANILFCFLISVAMLCSLFAQLEAHVWFADILAQFQTHALIGGLMALAISLWSRLRMGVLLSAIMVASASVALAPLLWHEAHAPTGSSPSVKIINYNVLSDSKHQEVIAAWIRQQKPDVIALIEGNYKWAETINSLKDILPYQTMIDHPVHYGMILLSHYPIENIRTLTSMGFFIPSLQADIALPIGMVRFILAHPTTPITPLSQETRNKQIAAYGPIIENSPLPVVLMGDFNAAPWTHSYLQLVREHKLYGSIITSSWPAPFHEFGVAIDQIVAGKGAVVSNVHTGPTHYSDHRARIAELSLAAKQNP